MDFKVDYKLEGKYADDIILLATSEAELQELVNRLDRVSRRYSLLINIDKTKVKQTGRQSGHRRRKYGKVTAYRFQRR